MKSVKRYNVNFIAGILLAIFSVYYASSTMFGHVHIIDGATIIHSHIHNSDHTTTPDGSHTSKEVTLIKALSLQHAIGGELVVLAAPVTLLEYAIPMLLSIDIVVVDQVEHQPSRAPPVFC